MSPARRSTARSGGDLATRIVAALVLIPLVLALVWAGVWPFLGLVAVLVVLMAHEWAALVHGGDFRQFLLHALAGLAAALAGLLVMLPQMALVVLAAWAASLALAWRDGRWGFYHVLGVPYIALPAFAMIILRGDPAWGALAVVFLLVVVWTADTAAYVAGRAIGGPKLAPVVSPNKTWAGFVGAMAGGALAAALFGLAASLTWWPLVLMGALLGAVEQGGDLLESAAKRRVGVKDSGALIPGHGGVLDRVDGLLAAALAGLIIGAWRGGGDLSRAAAGLLAW